MNKNCVLCIKIVLFPVVVNIGNCKSCYGVHMRDVSASVGVLVLSESCLRDYVVFKPEDGPLGPKHAVNKH